MIALKIAAAFFLLVLLAAIGWIVTHLRKIKRELIANEAMPRPGPRANFLLFVSVVLIGLSSLLIVYLFQ